jgi:hypothetical protein
MLRWVHLDGSLDNDESDGDDPGPMQQVSELRTMWHKCHYYPNFTAKSDLDRITYSQVVYDARRLCESPARGIEQLKFQQYLAHCQEVEATYNSELRYQRVNAACANYYCYLYMTFEKGEALHICQTCGSGRPNFYKDGSYDPDCF